MDTTADTSPERLAERYGTPLYVYDLDDVAAARDTLLDALPEGVEVYYALKANPHPAILETLRGAPGGPGCQAEISSVGELAAALAAGFAPDRILYTGPGKTEAELDLAVAAGVGLFSTDSVTDVRRLAAVALGRGTTAQALLRINSASAAAATGIRMTGTPSQFGFDAEDLGAALAEFGELPGVRLAGFHFFPLSNAFDEDNLIAEFRHTVTAAAALAEEHGIDLRHLDIGGGFAVPYGTPGPRAHYPKLRTELERALDLHLPGWRAGAPRVTVESGRYLAGGCGTLLASVVNVKVSRGRAFVIADAGINTFGGMSGLGRLLPVAVCPAEDGAATAKASLVGPLCTPGDMLGREIALPALAPGDLVRIPNTGAYGPTASLLMFLGRPAPTEVAVRGGRVVSADRIEHTRVPR